jgi:carbon monoxide dehydrogenase subunit G
MWWTLVAVALAGKWDGAPSDVEVQRVIAGDPDAAYAAIADLKRFAALLPEDCATDWVFQSATAGKGATAAVTYTMGPLKRKTKATVVEAEPGRIWRLEHEGDKKGFFTQVVFEGQAASTQVTLTSYLNPPPWPFKGPFHKKVHPAWTDCYERTLAALP